MAYNLTNVSQSEGFFELMTGITEVTGGWLFVMFTIVVFFIILIGSLSRGNQFINSLSAATFVSSIAGIMLSITGLISGSYLVYYALALAMAAGGAIVAGKQE